MQFAKSAIQPGKCIPANANRELSLFDRYYPVNRVYSLFEQQIISILSQYQCFQCLVERIRHFNHRVMARAVYGFNPEAFDAIFLQ